MPGPLITRRDIANAAISGQPRKFAKFGGKVRTARMFFYFKTANVAVAMPHSLGRTPTGWRVVTISRDGVPGVVYAPLQSLSSDTQSKVSSQTVLGRNALVLSCETANTWAEVEIW